MKVASNESVIEWTVELHARLAEVFAAGEAIQTDERAKWLLDYLQQQEIRIGDMVEGFQDQAAQNALDTQKYDWEAHTSVEIASLSDKPYGTMTYDEIAEDVMVTHNQIIELYRSMLARASISDEKKLFEALASVEEQETKQMSQSINRGRDM